MLHPRIRTFLRGLLWPFGLLTHLYSWWMPLRFGRIRRAALLPDSMAIWMVAVVGFSVFPFLGFHFFLIVCIVVLVSPAFLFMVVHVGEAEVHVYRFIAFLPYWRHRVPDDAIFELEEAWDDAAFTGVLFGRRSNGADFLSLGTSGSAMPLYLYIGGLLESAGWKENAFRYERQSG